LTEPGGEATGGAWHPDQCCAGADVRSGIGAELVLIERLPDLHRPGVGVGVDQPGEDVTALVQGLRIRQWSEFDAIGGEPQIAGLLIRKNCRVQVPCAHCTSLLVHAIHAEVVFGPACASRPTCGPKAGRPAVPAGGDQNDGRRWSMMEGCDLSSSATGRPAPMWPICLTPPNREPT